MDQEDWKPALVLYDTVAGNPNSVPLVCPAIPRLAREDSVLLTVDNARPKIKRKGSR